MKNEKKKKKKPTSLHLALKWHEHARILINEPCGVLLNLFILDL